MTRLIFWIVLIILVVMAVRSKLRAAIAPRAPAPGPAPGPRAAQPGQGASWRRVQDESERMSCCAQCGVYFPSSEAVAADGREYCCAAHARQPAR